MYESSMNTFKCRLKAHKRRNYPLKMLFLPLRMKGKLQQFIEQF